MTQHEIWKRLRLFPVPDAEERLWQMDIRMNAFGVRIDRELVDGALYADQVSRQELTEEAAGMTGLKNPNSVAQLKGWLEAQLGEWSKQDTRLPDLSKETVAALLARKDIPWEVRRILEIRKQLGRPP